MKRLLLLILAGSMIIAWCTGCHCRARSIKTDSRHFFKHTPEEIAVLTRGLKRHAEFVISEIEGPLREEIIAYLYHQIMEVGPLVYQTKRFANKQLAEVPIVADQIVKCLVRQVYDEFEILARQVLTYSEGQIAEIKPLHESFRRYLSHQYEHVDLFVRSVKRYEEVNVAQLRDLKLSVKRYFVWQYENAKAIPSSTARFINKMSNDYEEVMNSTGRYMAFHLKEKPVEVGLTLRRYAKYNMEELLPRLERSTGRYFWRQVEEIPELTKEIYCFTNKNLEETKELIGNVQKYFAINVAKTEELSREVIQFFRWRTEQWKMMKVEMDRFVSFNVDKLDMLAESPVRYIQHQKEEWERLKEVVPEYFLFNISKGEGLALAVRRYIRYNLGPDSGNCHQ